MEELYRRSTGNGLSGLKRIWSEEILELVPYVTGIREFMCLIPASFTVPGLLRSMPLIISRDGNVFLSHEVIGIKNFRVTDDT